MRASDDLQRPGTLASLGLPDDEDGTEPNGHTEPVADGAGRPRRRSRRWQRLADDWVPETLRDARVDPGRRGALVLSLVAALAAVVAAVGVWRSQPAPRPVHSVMGDQTFPVASPPVSADQLSSHGPAPPASRGVAAGSAVSVSESVSASAANEISPRAGAVDIWVSVTGLVRRPGLVRLRAGARVADAIAAAGGVVGEGSVTGLNLAVVLVDGDSVVIGPAPAAPPSGSVPLPGRRAGDTGAGAAGEEPTRAGSSATTGGSELINLNTADQATLETLPGVGPVMAGNILAWRSEHGPFTSVDQLQEVSGIGPARLKQLQPRVTV